MSMGSTGAEVGAGTAGSEQTGARSLGVLAFVLAVVFALFPYLSTPVIQGLQLDLSGSIGIGLLFLLVHEIGMVTALVLGILAVTRRRGRGWGIAAIVISVLLNQLLLGALIMGVISAITPMPAPG